MRDGDGVDVAQDQRVFLAGRIGLVDLIASGYRLFAILFLVVYLAPLLTIGLARLLARPSQGSLA